MDYMASLPETARGDKHFLVMMDHFIKWCEAVPTMCQGPQSFDCRPYPGEESLFQIWSTHLLHYDQGTNFESNLMHEICDVMGITKTGTTAYHPSGDGQVERQNRTLQNMLAAFISKHRGDWDLWLDPVV